MQKQKAVLTLKTIMYFKEYQVFLLPSQRGKCWLSNKLRSKCELCFIFKIRAKGGECHICSTRFGEFLENLIRAWKKVFFFFVKVDQSFHTFQGEESAYF